VVDAFLDTSILIDLLRNHPPAVQWRSANVNLITAISPYVWMEVIFGSRDGIAQSRAIKFMQQFTVVYPTQTEITWAMQRLQIHRLKDGVGILDCLIAAPSQRLQLPLYTQNLKHFAPLLGSLVQKPY
jgi:predicted nucleic acid-binding protein